MPSDTTLARLLRRLVRTKPDSREAMTLRMSAERALLEIVKERGKRGADAALASVRFGDRHLEHTPTAPHVSTWSATFGEAGGSSLEVWFSARRDVQATSVRYTKVIVPKLTAAQRARQEIQEEFYKRYMEVGQRWYRGLGPRRLRRTDQVILLVGELEADVNNGGFRQYLDNKGRRRARSALAALRAVRAVKTARMLTAAMARGATDERLGELDDQFYKAPEDLAVMTMRWLQSSRA